jgi:hypothetical protein
LNANKGFGLTVYLVALVAVAGLMLGAFVYGSKVEAEGWIAVVANLESELDSLKRQGTEREARANKAAQSVTAQLAKERKERDVERKKWADDARTAWAAHIDSVQSAAGANPGGDALSACIAARDATRAGLEQLLSAGERAREASDITRAQLYALLGWLAETTR